ncbi:MAG: fibronectin type III domain-containing protein, partial [Myxococcaceae bacterium]
MPTEVVFTSNSISARVLDPADAYHFLLIEADGGITSSGLFRHAPAASNSVAYGYLPRECRFRLMASRIVGGETSVWSAPSSEFWVDLQPPRPPTGLLLAERDGGISVTWAPATDSCTGVGAYRVERLTTGAAVIISTSSATTVFDVPSSPGQVRYRVRAIDDAGWLSDSLLSSAVTWPPPVDAGAMDAGAMDAGAMDAGAMDAGAMDAGSMDAGSMAAGAMDAGAMDAGAVPTTTTQLVVGCGCS